METPNLEWCYKFAKRLDKTVRICKKIALWSVVYLGTAIPVFAKLLK